MMISTQELLDTSVAQLRTLSAFLDEQLCQRDGPPVRATSGTEACNEILQSLRALIVRVQGICVTPCTEHHHLWMNDNDNRDDSWSVRLRRSAEMR